MARKPTSDSGGPGLLRRVPLTTLLSYGVSVAAAVAVAMMGFFAFLKVQQLLVADTRFQLTPPEEAGQESPNLEFEGVVYASRRNLLRVFEQDFGRSIYLVPLAERRKSLIGVEWVKDATVQRIWPNRIRVKITERRPVAFLQVPDPRGPQIWRSALVDEDAEVLRLSSPAPFRLPVVVGVTPDQTPEVRLKGVRRMLRFLRETGELGERASEIDVRDPDNLCIVWEGPDGQAVLLKLGTRRYFERLEYFAGRYASVRRRAAGARIFDLRVDGTITAVEGDDSGE